MPRVFEGEMNAAGLKFGIVVSRFNEIVTKAMLEGALNELRRAGASEEDLSVVWVSGAYEIPLALHALATSQKPEALIALGCIIKGETDHYAHIADSVCRGVEKISLGEKVPIGFGVLTVEDMGQALDRSGGKTGNRGRDAARTALEMARVLGAIRDEGEREQILRERIEVELKR